MFVLRNLLISFIFSCFLFSAFACSDSTTDENIDGDSPENETTSDGDSDASDTNDTLENTENDQTNPVDGDLDQEQTDEQEVEYYEADQKMETDTGEQESVEETEKETEQNTEIETEADQNEIDIDASSSCPVPQAPTMATIHNGAILKFTVKYNLPVMTGTSSNRDATEPSAWNSSNELTLSNDGEITVFAKVDSDLCVLQDTFKYTYKVKSKPSDKAGPFPPKAGDSGSTAVSMDSKSIKAWATGYIKPVNFGTNVDEKWKKPENALGPADNGGINIVVLGDDGDITLTFDSPIKNGNGFDFCVFENGFVNGDKGFLEFAFIEVSTDGTHFIRFSSAHLNTETIGGFGAQNTSLSNDLAGKYAAGWGTPFDLENLKNTDEVTSGLVDLNEINYVKIVDIIGDGSCLDSFGNPIYDPYPVADTAGFDLDAVGVINN